MRRGRSVLASLRLIHIADAHLDTPFYGREESLRRRLREACREAFKNAVDEAIDRDVHAVLIAGDLFDNDRLSFATEQFILVEMERMKEAGIRVLYATGNHDPGRANYRAHDLAWPENVHLFRSANPETVPLHDSGGQKIGYVTGAGHNSAKEGSNLAALYEPSSDELPHIGLLHAQVLSAAGAEAHERYAPCTVSDLVGKQYNYWALGHIHIRQRVGDDVPGWYAGNIQGRNPGETGPKGVLYVEIDRVSAPEPEFIPVAPVIWDKADVSVSRSISQLEPLVNRLVGDIKAQVALDDGLEHLIRVDLSGESPLAGELNRHDNLEDLCERVRTELDLAWLEIKPGALLPPVDVEKFRESRTVLAEIFEIMDRLPQDDELLEDICPMHIARSDVPDKKAYLRSLLEGLDRQAASLLVRDKPGTH